MVISHKKARRDVSSDVLVTTIGNGTFFHLKSSPTPEDLIMPPYTGLDQFEDLKSQFDEQFTQDGPRSFLYTHLIRYCRYNQEKDCPDHGKTVVGFLVAAVEEVLMQAKYADLVGFPPVGGPTMYAFIDQLVPYIYVETPKGELAGSQETIDHLKKMMTGKLSASTCKPDGRIVLKYKEGVFPLFNLEIKSGDVTDGALKQVLAAMAPEIAERKEGYVLYMCPPRMRVLRLAITEHGQEQVQDLLYQSKNFELGVQIEEQIKELILCLARLVVDIWNKFGEDWLNAL